MPGNRMTAGARFGRAIAGKSGTSAPLLGFMEGQTEANTVRRERRSGLLDLMALQRERVRLAAGRAV